MCQNVLFIQKYDILKNITIFFSKYVGRTRIFNRVHSHFMAKQYYCILFVVCTRLRYLFIQKYDIFKNITIFFSKYVGRTRIFNRVHSHFMAKQYYCILFVVCTRLRYNCHLFYKYLYTFLTFLHSNHFVF